MRNNKEKNNLTINEHIEIYHPWVGIVDYEQNLDDVSYDVQSNFGHMMGTFFQGLYDVCVDDKILFQKKEYNYFPIHPYFLCCEELGTLFCILSNGQFVGIQFDKQNNPSNVLVRDCYILENNNCEHKYLNVPRTNDILHIIDTQLTKETVDLIRDILSGYETEMCNVFNCGESEKMYVKKIPRNKMPFIGINIVNDNCRVKRIRDKTMNDHNVILL